VNDLKVVGLSVVKNEGDVIEAFVRHNLRYLDYLFILDNDSVDETGKILLKLRQEGLPVWSFHDSIPAHAQSDKISCLLRHAQSLFRPSFAVFLDADEFIRCPSRAEFNRLLHGIQPFSMVWSLGTPSSERRGTGGREIPMMCFGPFITAAVWSGRSITSAFCGPMAWLQWSCEWDLGATT
jgi:Glycosyl transferase family 2